MSTTRASLYWSRVLDSLWFIPTLGALVGAGLSVALVRVEQVHVANLVIGESWGVDGARGVLSAIAGSLITVTGTVFSISIVALQLASAQFTPRVLRTFVADRANHVVYAIFIGTFTYALLVLRSIRDPRGPDDQVFVPAAAVTLAVLLVLVSIAALIFYINHAAHSIRASVLVDREARLTIERIEEMFPQGTEAARRDAAAARWCGDEHGPSSPVLAGKAGYVQAVQVDVIRRVAERCQVTVRMEHRVGDFVYQGEPLATVFPAGRLDDRDLERVAMAVVLGSERTAEQDVEFGIIEISDIAVKAMSPAINDPTTALTCIDRLAEILLELGRRHLAPDFQPTKDGLIFYIGLQTTFERAAGLAFDPVRHYGAADPVVARKLLDCFARLATCLPCEHDAVLRAHALAVLETVRQTSTVTLEREAVERLAERLIAVIEHPERGGARRAADMELVPSLR